MTRTKSWTDFVATLEEMQPYAFDGFTPVQPPRPVCPHTVEIGGATRYRYDGSNLFLIDRPTQPDDEEPCKRINASNTPWIRIARTEPIQTPLGWSLVMGRPLFWLTENLILPAQIAAWVLWKNRETGIVWRATDPGKKNAAIPTAAWADEDATRPALAYLMPFASLDYPPWSELHHGSRGAELP
jgi:hypothetical protein